MNLNTLNLIENEVKKAEEAFLIGNYKNALYLYQKAIDLIPEPKKSWNESWVFFYGISEMYFQNENYDKAIFYLKECIQCPFAIGNPHVHLRIGQVRYELGNFDKAEDELMRAFMGGGREIFINEDEKYFSLIKKHIK